jgi:N utilization substance protein B
VQLRRKARQIALETLYEIDCANHPPGLVLERRVAEAGFNGSTASFLQGLVQGVLANVEMLDTIIHEHAPEWPVDQMAIVDRNILRMAIYEMVIDETTPIKVAINEAVELAKSTAATAHLGSSTGCWGRSPHRIAISTIRLKTSLMRLRPILTDQSTHWPDAKIRSAGRIAPENRWIPSAESDYLNSSSSP